MTISQAQIRRGVWWASVGLNLIAIVVFLAQRNPSAAALQSAVVVGLVTLDGFTQKWHQEVDARIEDARTHLETAKLFQAQLERQMAAGAGEVSVRVLRKDVN